MRTRVRYITDLQGVAFAEKSPWPKTRYRGTRAKGKAFERKVGKALAQYVKDGKIEGDLYDGVWLKFEDANGPGHAQPDYFIDAGDKILLTEVKLKQNSTAIEQLVMLYKPLLAELFQKPVFMLQAFKFISAHPGSTLVGGPWEVLGKKEDSLVYNWHFLG